LDDGSKEHILSPGEVERLVGRGKTVSRATVISALALTLCFLLLV